MGERKINILQELFYSFKYMIESKKGKYSLDTYLDIIGEYGDRLIFECREDGFEFIGGNCRVSWSEGELEKIRIQIELFFVSKDGEKIKKEAERYLDSDKFTTETISKIRENKDLVFEIEAPIER